MHPKAILERHGLEAKKSLGQNFLFDPNVLQRIVAAADVSAADEVLEVGPGLGSLTEQLAQHAGRVVAIELDDRLMPILRLQLGRYPNVTLVHGDILEQNPADWFTQDYKVVANVPYYITGGILRHLLAAEPRPSLLVLTIQKEVAERVTAEPGAMSLLSASVQFYGRPEIVTNLAAGAFWPRPNVASSVLRIDTNSRIPATTAIKDEAAFFRLLKAGFAQKRKQIHSNLRALGYNKDTIVQALASAAVDGRRRAETLSLEEWVALYYALEK